MGQIVQVLCEHPWAALHASMYTYIDCKAYAKYLKCVCRVSKTCLCLLGCWKLILLKLRTFPKEIICQTPAPMCSKQLLPPIYCHTSTAPIYCHPSTATHLLPLIVSSTAPVPFECCCPVQPCMQSMLYMCRCCMLQVHCVQACTESIQLTAVLLARIASLRSWRARV